MSKIALGTWAWGAGAFGGDKVFGSKTDVENLKPVFDAAMKAGLSLWDTATAYGMGESEKILGSLAKDYKREQVEISTKFTPQIAEFYDKTDERGCCPAEAGASRALPLLCVPAAARRGRCHPRGHLYARHAEGRRHQAGDKRRWAIPWRAGTRHALLGAHSPEVIRMLLTITTPDRLLYGSDYPYVAPQVLTQSLARMKQYLTTEADLAPYKEMILWKNAQRLFQIGQCE